MKAIRLHQATPPPVLDDTPIPAPGGLQARVTACGVCRTDLHIVDKEHIARERLIRLFRP